MRKRLHPDYSLRWVFTNECDRVQWLSLDLSASHLETVIPKAGVFQPAEGSCVGYPCLTAREIPHYA
jgi:hypothetical protein